MPLTIFFDGACPLCSRRIDGYRSVCPDDRLRLVDISIPDFLPPAGAPAREEFGRVLHVRDAAGRWLIGVDALRAIWQVLPLRRYRLLAILLGWPGIGLLARGGYRLLAASRHRFTTRGWW
ncbi:thiol-disulfide oxidoreductase DCC family protein [Geothermobacter ehrlichii]|uniref:thiol-disulfide oxidoreductase DCC family protein n=1 Tax=Geothermobacter ehrlichii TaxID=213224 RepID=UPI001652F028|nr:DUF393 domain-containing protein [Geothermobacter ehrlichii]